MYLGMDGSTFSLKEILWMDQESGLEGASKTMQTGLGLLTEMFNRLFQEWGFIAKLVNETFSLLLKTDKPTNTIFMK